MKTITITEKEYTKALPVKEYNSKKYPATFSASGILIDELAYCAGQWTSEDLYDNNFEYEPSEPYNFNYEADLLANTKTLQALTNISNTLEIEFLPNMWIHGASNLQAGAQLALNNPEQFDELLKAYKEKLQEDRTYGISKSYNEQLQSEIDNYNNGQYNEWLNGDHRNYAGVVHEIAKYFTDARDGLYTKYNHETKTEASYTFELNEDDIETAKYNGYTKAQLKKWLLDSIIGSGNSRASKDKTENEKRKTERERLTAYKAEQKATAEAERKAKLLSMVLTK